MTDGAPHDIRIASGNPELPPEPVQALTRSRNGAAETVGRFGSKTSMTV